MLEIVIMMQIQAPKVVFEIKRQGCGAGTQSSILDRLHPSASEEGMPAMMGKVKLNLGVSDEVSIEGILCI